MSESLTKKAIKKELERRIDYFEKAYGFTEDWSIRSIEGKSSHLCAAYGRYRALLEMKWQVRNNLFLGGFAS